MLVVGVDTNEVGVGVLELMIPWWRRGVEASII